MSANFIRDYLQDIGKYPQLKLEQELELGRRIADGDQAAREMLINCNLKLVVFVAKKYKNTHLPLEDLIMEGNSGLITAVDKFDYTRGYKFSTCAVPWIKQAILKAITDKGKSIRLPAHIYAQINKMKQAIEDLELDGNLDPTDEQIAAKMGVDLDRVINLKKWKKDALSLSTPLGDEEKNTLEDLVPDMHEETPVEYAEEQLLQEKILGLLSAYKPRTQTIIKMRYGFGQPGDPEEYFQEHTLEEIGAYLNLTRERVRQIEKETLQDMKNKWDM